MQQDVVIASILVVLMGKPVAGTHMKFDITDGMHGGLRKMQYSILHIGSSCTPRMTGKEELAEVTISQW
jgi:hypothetical protein